MKTLDLGSLLHAGPQTSRTLVVCRMEWSRFRFQLEERKEASWEASQMSSGLPWQWHTLQTGSGYLATPDCKDTEPRHLMVCFREGRTDSGVVDEKWFP